MLRDFEEELAGFQEEQRRQTLELERMRATIQERENSLKTLTATNRQSANEIGLSIYTDIGSLLKTTGEARRNWKGALRTLLAEWANPYLINDLNHYAPDELWSYWTLRNKPTDLGEPNSHLITITARGGKTPNTANRSFIFITDFPHSFEANPKESFVWTRKDPAKRILGQRAHPAHPLEARFFRNVLNKTFNLG